MQGIPLICKMRALEYVSIWLVLTSLFLLALVFGISVQDGQYIELNTSDRSKPGNTV